MSKIDNTGVTQKYNIICLSNQLWDFPNWTNKRHVMSRLAKLGHNVLFVDPPINAGWVFLRQILRGTWGLSRFFTFQKLDESSTHIFTPINFLPFYKFTSFLHILKIQALTKKLFNPDLKTILWVYHVEIDHLQDYIAKLPYDLLIYDCVDNYEGFPIYDTPYKKEKIRSQERYLATKANLVFATAPGLVDKLKNYNKNLLFTPNVGDYEKFKNVAGLKTKIPNELDLIPRPRIGFSGSLDEYKFDAKLMKKVALDNPECSFVLIGQIALKDRSAGLKELDLDKIKNIYFLGYVPFPKMEYYFAGLDAYIIPYQLNDYTVGGCFPIKFHDALAAGLPTIVTNLPAYTPFKDVCYISKNYEEFSVNVKKAIGEDSEVKFKERQAVAKQNSWEGKVRTMLEHVATVLVYSQKAPERKV